MLNFATSRPPGKAKVRAYNPQIEEHGYGSSHTIVEVVNDDMPFLVDSVTQRLADLDAQVHLVIHPILEVARDADGKLLDIHSAAGTVDSPEGQAAAALGKKAPAPSRGAARKAATNGGDTATKTRDNTKAANTKADDAGQTLRESVMHVEISEQPASRLSELEQELSRVLTDVRAAVRDWRAMQDQARQVIDGLKASPPPLAKAELDEGVAFLEWVADDNFTFLGYREYSFEGTGAGAVAQVNHDSGKGILSDPEYRLFDGLRDLGKLPQEVQAFLHQPELLRVTKANRRSTVHRAVHLDTIAVKTFDGDGNVTGEKLIAGLFTSTAYSRSPREIPLLRRKVDRVLERSGFRPDSHDGKALLHILESYPRDELFQIGEDDLYRIAMGILHLQERQRIALFTRQDPFERFVSCLVFVPRDRHDTHLRLRFQEILAQAFNGEVSAFYTHLTEAVLARTHIIVRTTPGEIPDVDKTAVETRLAEAARSWSDQLQEALIEDRGEEPGLATTRRFGTAFPASYEEHFPAKAAVYDIVRIERAIDTNDLAMNLYRPIEASEDQVRFKIYHVDQPIPLSDILPMLENMGIKVISEHPYDVHPTDRRLPVWLHDFEMRTAGGEPVDLGRVRDKFHEAFARIWRGEMENDGFNRLVLLARLTARDVIVLRTYCKYLRQAGIPFSQAYMEDTLAENPALARLLVELFRCRFDPDMQADRADREEQEGRIVQHLTDGLEQVESLDQDRIVRRFLNAIQATQRTNYYQPMPDGGERPWLSIKLASEQIDELPLPKPFREIFVYSPRVEGVHLRFGMVARGGLRWSDRREDFRTEVLGLVKAQQVKNAVIVPVGSKGGFVPKQPPPPSAGRPAMQEEGIACYKTFVRGLLDITDNFVGGGQVRPPEKVVRWDGDDPYLVVAPDKGTAAFSDIANAVSQEYGFWLDDAFASGGSSGYDHKVMGITAKGAWESVKRHFREMGHDTQREDFTVVGCGDMSGDVFGNGMICSEHIRLIGAFNHLHIFVDPNPDAAESYQERKRLFDAAKGWDAYDTSKISQGGGVFERKAKSITLTPEIQQLFGLQKEQVAPNELVHAMLKANCGLLWFGGIGTYIKASDESHADVGDRGNDAIRVDADELGCSVIGEGANLGVTQLARIEFALNGGRCNTDAIDNSGGVDCSDHEVNIKILLGMVEEAGDITRKQRNELLQSMTDEVAHLVLRDNYLQTQAISVTERLGAHLLDRSARFMRALERQGKLNRMIEHLPDDETILERRKAGIGLTRPEIAVLMSYAKIVLYEELLASDLPDDPYMAADLKTYFPEQLRQRYPGQIEEHRLNREIVATSVTNSIVNRCGMTFVHETREKTGMPSHEVARAYTAAREIFGLREVWAGVEALDNIAPTETQADMLTEAGRLIERATSWFLRSCNQPIDISEVTQTFTDGVATVAGQLDELLAKSDLQDRDRRARYYLKQGAGEELALRVASLRLLPPALDICRIASTLEMEVASVARTFFAVGQRFGFDWLRQAANQLPTDDAWDKLAVGAIIDDFYGHQSDLTTRVLQTYAPGSNGSDAVEAWAHSRQALVTRTEQLVTELRSAGSPDLAMLAVANRQLKSMVSGG
ncbi:NAD-glutamate dehydrogenase [Rhodovibrio salinarum]|uniref:NAD-glutamate dehydrogenase n=2 Tax=Rhodovibrio salinarum TaxID=1087 RepID=A0A934QH63_9PROT|nr:NAD-glutamate dehydrogenase [Rhodovibrio salinarum]